MIGFKKVPTKAILILFAICIFLILLLYADVSTDESLPEEKVQISEELQSELPEIFSYKMHEVKDGENLSIIFEDFKVPLNTCLLYTSPSPRDVEESRMPSSA